MKLANRIRAIVVATVGIVVIVGSITAGIAFANRGPGGQPADHTVMVDDQTVPSSTPTPDDEHGDRTSAGPSGAGDREGDNVGLDNPDENVTTCPDASTVIGQHSPDLADDDCGLDDHGGGDDRGGDD